MGRDNLLIAPLDTIVLPVEDAEKALAGLDMDEHTWTPEFYYSRSLDTTARVEQAALSWMAIRGDLSASRVRTSALESMRRDLLACVAGARFLHQPERCSVDFQALQDHYDHAIASRCYVTLAASLAFGQPTMDYGSDDSVANPSSFAFAPG
jgi:hypothetical protein